jgi:hypothetical protein
MTVAGRCVFRCLKRTEAHFTPEQEARLAQIATNVEGLVKKTVLRLLEDEVASRANVFRTNG